MYVVSAFRRTGQTCVDSVGYRVYTPPTFLSLPSGNAPKEI